MTSHFPILQPGQFPCIQCGACCRCASQIPELLLAGYTLPNGQCRFLTKPTVNGVYSCSIYSIRPGICRINRMKEILSPDSSLHAWYAENLRSCLLLLQQEQQKEESPNPDSHSDFTAQLRLSKAIQRIQDLLKLEEEAASCNS